MKVLLVIAVVFCLAKFALATPPFEQFTEIGVPGVGFNRGASGLPIWSYTNLQFLTQPPFNFPSEVLFAGFNTSGAFDTVVGEGGGNSQSITPATPGSALLASHFDDVGMPLLGVSRPKVPDSRLNIPLDDNFVLADDFGINRQKIGCTSNVGAHNAITRAAPCNDPITLERWVEASGVLRVRCYVDPSAEVKAKLVLVMQDLMPNRLYTAWYVAVNFPQGHIIQGFPLGGVPNSFTTNANGYYLLQREMGFCPFNESTTLGFAVHLRGDGQNYGGIPVPFLNQEDASPEPFSGFEALFPGSAIHIQLNFNGGHGESASPPADENPIRAAKNTRALQLVDNEQVWMF